MKVDRPLWSASAQLSAQQFQQQARWEAWNNECIAHLALAHPWGVDLVEFDRDALRLGKLKATQLRLRMPDGTLIDTLAVDDLPDALALDALPRDPDKGVVVALTLALEQANGNNCLFEGDPVDRLPRYRQVWRSIQDLYGNGCHSVSVLQHGLRLSVVGEREDPNVVACPLTRLVRDAQGVWTHDPDYVPPLLRFAAHPGLLLQLDNLLIQLNAKRQRLMGMRRESNERMADFAVADVSIFWLLNALNSYQPILANLMAHPARHPEFVYHQLAMLAGSLLTFSLDHDVEQIPLYQHQQLSAVFAPLMRMISVLLEASLPSRVVALAVERTGKNRWQTRLEDPRLREPGGADFYLSVRSSTTAAQLQDYFPRVSKAAAPDDIDGFITLALEGIPLRPLSHVPAAVPLRLENRYFALDVAHEKGQAMLAAGACVFYVPSTLADVELEVFAVVRT